MPWQHLLTPVPEPVVPEDLRADFACLSQLAGAAGPFVLACLGGQRAATPGLAFLAGYQAALRALWPQAPAGLGALCATEGRSLRPAELQTRYAEGRVSGRKGFVTAADAADWLLVAAREEGEGEAPRLAMLQLPACGPGVQLEPGPVLALMPEVPHARLLLQDAAAEQLPGDGWDDYVKPFRSLEDLYVHSALIAWLLATAQRCAWPQPLQLRLLALLASAAEVARQAPAAAATHLLLGGLFEQFAVLRPELDAALAAGPAHWQQLWQRDRGILELAGAARAARLDKAWQALVGRGAESA